MVVEAAQPSGSLITARKALELGRELGAVPGPVTSRVSEGTNGLLADGAATIRDAQELIGLDRRERETASKGLRLQYEHESANRDFAAERVELTAAAQAAEGQVEEAEQSMTARTADRLMTEDAERQLRDLQPL